MVMHLNESVESTNRTCANQGACMLHGSTWQPADAMYFMQDEL